MTTILTTLACARVARRALRYLSRRRRREIGGFPTGLRWSGAALVTACAITALALRCAETGGSPADGAVLVLGMAAGLGAASDAEAKAWPTWGRAGWTLWAGSILSAGWWCSI